jgi:hypothetical protein
MLVGALAAAGASESVLAHGFAGKRFFPATLATDDPFVADELSLPTVTQTKSRADGDNPATTQTTTSVDVTKRVTPNFGVGLSVDYLRIQPEGGDTVKGTDNLAASLKYQFHRNDEHESIASIGLDWDIGNSGAKRVNPESFSTVTPTVFYGKGFGDLPDSVPYLRPFALTGSAGVAMPMRASTTTFDEDGNPSTEQHPNTLKLGLAVQYSLQYLQSVVKDVGLGAPFNRMIPLVEFSWQKPVDRGGGAATGTWNPGVLWAGRYMQFGIEAILPMNNATPVRRGWIAQIHFFIDDVFPRSMGRPIFGGTP